MGIDLSGGHDFKLFSEPGWHYFLPYLLFSRLQFSGKGNVNTILLSPEQKHEVTHSIQFTCTPFCQTLAYSYGAPIRKLIRWFHQKREILEQKGYVPVKLPLFIWAEKEECPAELREIIKDVKLYDEGLELICWAIVKPWHKQEVLGPLTIIGDTDEHLLPQVIRRQKATGEYFTTGIGLTSVLEGWASALENNFLQYPEPEKFWGRLSEDDLSAEPTNSLLHLYTATRDLVIHFLGSYYSETLLVLSDFSLLTTFVKNDFIKSDVVLWYPGWRFINALKAVQEGIGPFEEFRPKAKVDERYKEYYKMISEKCQWLSLDEVMRHWKAQAEAFNAKLQSTFGIDWSALGCKAVDFRRKNPSAIALSTFAKVPKIFYPAFWSTDSKSSYWLNPYHRQLSEKGMSKSSQDEIRSHHSTVRIGIEEWFLVRQMLSGKQAKCSSHYLGLHCPFSRSCKAIYPLEEPPKIICPFWKAIGFFYDRREPTASWWNYMMEQQNTEHFSSQQECYETIKSHLTIWNRAEVELAEKVSEDVTPEFKDASVSNAPDQETYAMRSEEMKVLWHLVTAIRADVSARLFPSVGKEHDHELILKQANTVVSTLKIIRHPTTQTSLRSPTDQAIILALQACPTGMTAEELCEWLCFSDFYNIGQWTAEDVCARLDKLSETRLPKNKILSFDAGNNKWLICKE